MFQVLENTDIRTLRRLELHIESIALHTSQEHQCFTKMHTGVSQMATAGVKIFLYMADKTYYRNLTASGQVTMLLAVQ